MAKKKVVKQVKRSYNRRKHVSTFTNTGRAMSLCDQAEDAISNLEAKLSKIIRRINTII